MFDLSSFVLSDELNFTSIIGLGLSDFKFVHAVSFDAESLRFHDGFTVDVPSDPWLWVSMDSCGEFSSSSLVDGLRFWSHGDLWSRGGSSTGVWSSES